MVVDFAGLDLARLLSQRAAERRDRPFLIWAPFDAPARVWSYECFADSAARAAGGLAARGVGSSRHYSSAAALRALDYGR